MPASSRSTDLFYEPSGPRQRTYRRYPLKHGLRPQLGFSSTEVRFGLGPDPAPMPAKTLPLTGLRAAPVPETRVGEFAKILREYLFIKDAQLTFIILQHIADLNTEC